MKNPYSKQPPFKFATISSGATEAFIKQNYPTHYEYMRQFNQTSAAAGIESLKKGVLDAFIYDATVLEYKSSHDNECELNVVGKWYAMTGYGIGFPRSSPWRPIFEKYIVEYQFSGFLQQLSDYWLSGACKYRKQAEANKSFQLGIPNLTSAFVLLATGLLFCLIALVAETVLSKYLVSYIVRKKIELREKVIEKWKSGKIDGRKSVVLKKLSKSVSNPKWNPLQGILNNAMLVKCKNCGGRGHISTVCPSHPSVHQLIDSKVDKV